MFNIKKVKPLFTSVITSATVYSEDIITKSGLVIPNKLTGQLNPYQTVTAVGDMVKNIKVGDIVKINFKRYIKARHTPGSIDEDQNIQHDDMSVVYELPTVEINGVKFLNLQNSDIEYVVEDAEIGDDGLLQ